MTELTDEHQRLIDDMFETMYAAHGIGLAAPQVGRLDRIAVVHVDEHKLVLVNPEITGVEGNDKAEEGCLSIPDIYGDVERPSRITITALDCEMQPYTLAADGLLGRCIQHEVDHLHGRLFVDYLGLVRRRAAIAKWNRQRKGDRSLTRTLTPEAVAEHRHRDEEL